MKDVVTSKQHKEGTDLQGLLCVYVVVDVSVWVSLCLLCAELILVILLFTSLYVPVCVRACVHLCVCVRVRVRACWCVRV